jgi:hypothetical protein
MIMAENQKNQPVQGQPNDKKNAGTDNRNQSSEKNPQTPKGNDDQTTGIKREHDDSDHPHKYKTPGSDQQNQRNEQGTERNQGNERSQSNQGNQRSEGNQNQGNQNQGNAPKANK